MTKAALQMEFDMTGIGLLRFQQIQRGLCLPVVVCEGAVGTLWDGSWKATNSSMEPNTKLSAHDDSELADASKLVKASQILDLALEQQDGYLLLGTVVGWFCE